MKKRIFILAALLSTGLIGSMTATTKSSHSEIMTKEADGVTGATFSSKAVKENVKRGIAYYLKHK